MSRDDRSREESVPAGRGGADSGAADLVGVSGTTSGTPDEGTDNDIAGVGPRGADPAESQDAPAEDVHDASRGDRVSGVLVQVQADLATGHIAEADVVSVLSQRLDEAGIVADDDELAALGQQALSVAAPTSLEEAEPGAEQ
jgi:hypothetical protein